MHAKLRFLVALKPNAKLFLWLKMVAKQWHPVTIRVVMVEQKMNKTLLIWHCKIV